MSSISSASGQPSILQWLQQQVQNQENAAQNPQAAQTITGTDSDGDNDGSSSTSSTAGLLSLIGGHHGHHHHSAGGISSQLESAITSALQNANGTTGSTSSTGSTDSTDANSVITNAIASFLQSSANGTTNTTSGTDSSATGSTSGTPTDPQSAFLQLLQSNGVDPQQFHADLFSAIQTAQQNGTQVDFSKVFSSFPPGSVVDTVA
jgi:hypothetical protein